MSECTQLQTLKTPADYMSEAGVAFPSPAALDWFIRRHRKRLTAAGAVLKINRRMLIDQERFDRVVLEVGRLPHEVEEWVVTSKSDRAESRRRFDRLEDASAFAEDHRSLGLDVTIERVPK
jgi:hypothetical protein